MRGRPALAAGAIACAIGCAGIARGDVSGLAHQTGGPRELHPSAQTSPHARCRDGKTVIGGGARITGGGGGAISSSYPLTPGASGNWSATVYNDGHRDLRVTANAVCAGPSFAEGINWVRSSGDVGSPSASTTLTADCFLGDIALGGGGASNAGYPPGAPLTGSRPVDGVDADNDPGDAWEVRVDNLSASPPNVFVAADVLCAPSGLVEPHIRVISSLERARAGETRTVTADCRRGATMVSGGYWSTAGYGESEPQVSALEAENTQGERLLDSWEVRIRNISATRIDVLAYGLCAR